jgi:predicted amidophosphoribosyltransferase
VENDPYSDISRERVDFWDADNTSLSLFRYKPVRSRIPDTVTQFILGFKDFDSECLKAAWMQVYDAMEKVSKDWKRDYDCRHILPVPSHTAYQISPSSNSVCQFIAKMFPWLQYPEGLLFRRESVIPAHLYPEQRPSAKEHFESLGCSKADLVGAGVILFDDVRTTGNTSQACRWRLRRDANAGEVVRLFLGRTET